jgi:hypothetical protein
MICSHIGQTRFAFRNLRATGRGRIHGNIRLTLTDSTLHVINSYLQAATIGKILTGRFELLFVVRKQNNHIAGEFQCSLSRDVVSVSNVSVSRRLETCRRLVSVSSRKKWTTSRSRLGLGTKHLGLVSISFSNVS